jgi:hypothetical protein
MPDRRRRGKLSGLGSDEICATAIDEISKLDDTNLTHSPTERHQKP